MDMRMEEKKVRGGREEEEDGEVEKKEDERMRRGGRQEEERRMERKRRQRDLQPFSSGNSSDSFSFPARSRRRVSFSMFSRFPLGSV